MAVRVRGDRVEVLWDTPAVNPVRDTRGGSDRLPATSHRRTCHSSRPPTTGGSTSFLRGSRGRQRSPGIRSDRVTEESSGTVRVTTGGKIYPPLTPDRFLSTPDSTLHLGAGTSGLSPGPHWWSKWLRGNDTGAPVDGRQGVPAVAAIAIANFTLVSTFYGNRLTVAFGTATLIRVSANC